MKALAYRRVPALLLLLAWSAPGHSKPSQNLETPFEAIIPFFRQHCVKCHGAQGKAAGKIDLYALTSPTDLLRTPELVVKVIEALELQDMPPETEPAMVPEVRLERVKELKALLQRSLSTDGRPEHAPIRRLNRFQYSNAVQDLFQLTVLVFPLPERMMREHDGYFQPATGKVPEKVKVGSRPLGKSQLIEPHLSGVTAFPQDLRAEHGFDTQGDHLSLSPLLMEAFLELSRSIVESKEFNQKTCGIWNTFFATPPSGADVHPVLRERLRVFLSRAFRRPADDALVERYAAHVLRRLESGASFTDGMKSAASAALASPRFLYLYDDGPGDDTAAAADYALASRLSFFLWGSIPDEELLAVAASGKLSARSTLKEQIDRMLADRRLKRFCDSFPAQWLQLDRIISSVPDESRFPTFYWTASSYRTSLHMMLEPLLIFETTLIEDRSILELIDSDYSYRSKRLRRWYERTSGTKGGATVIEFERVPVTDRRQGGIITTAAVLTMTSGPQETKPITRGAWIAGVVFNDPPEPPPADVPLLEAPDAADKDLTLRERFAAHRENASCAGCHAKLDPLGFALENFDAVGRWRDRYEGGQKIDASGILFRKHAFDDIIGFKDAILTEKDRFTRGFAAHVLSFALGRKVGAADFASLEIITRETARADYSLRSLLHEVIQSESFVGRKRPPRRRTLRL